MYRNIIITIHRLYLFHIIFYLYLDIIKVDKNTNKEDIYYVFCNGGYD